MTDAPHWLDQAVAHRPSDGEWTRQEISHSDFEVWCYFRSDSAGTAPTHMVVLPVDGGDPAAQARGITTTVLREIRPSRAGESPMEAGNATPEQRTYPLASLVEARLTTPGRPTDAYLAALSLRYERLADSGERSPVRKLVEITGRSLGTVKSHLQLARRRGFLDTVGSKAGGRATEKAQSLLRNTLPDKDRTFD
ncbi:hypothetical protein [Streptomyces lavendulae]